MDCSQVMLCIKKRDERTDEGKPICPANFFKVRGIKRRIKQASMYGLLDKSADS